MRILVMALLFASASLNLLTGQQHAPSLLQNIASRKVTTLDGKWKIIVDPLENGYYNHRYQPRDDGYFKNGKAKSPSDLIEYDFDTDVELQVPGDWNTQMEKLYYYEGTVWYKRSFDYSLPKENRVYVYFEGVNYTARVYLNGEYLGYHEGGFTPFQFEITGGLKEKDNFLVIKVDNVRKKEGVPTLNTDWWNYGGVTRSVHLVEVPQSHIADYFLRLSDDGKMIEGWVRADGAVEGSRVEIGIPELKKNVAVTTDASGMASFSFKAKPELWSPDKPKRYAVTLEMGNDKIQDQIGFRSIITKGTDILLNGKPIFLKGISIHEEAPFRTGRVTTLEQVRTLLQWARELGCNYVRLAHYPHSEVMVQEAEAMGLMIWSEIPVYWTVEFNNEDTYRNAENQLMEMISRDKNRAGILLWSVANETPISGERTEFLGRLATKARAMDPSRLITAALDTHSEEDGVKVIDDPLAAVVDVIGINYYCGWYTGNPGSCGSIRWKNLYDKPMVMSEVGGGALQGLHGTAEQRWTEEYQDEVYKENIEMIRNISFLRGLSPWILMDFRSSRRHLRPIQNDFNRKGLISEQGIRKKAFFTLQEYYLNEN